MAKIIICSKCGRERKHQGKGMCASCYVREYKKNNNYEGPIRKCIDCSEIKAIKAKDRCKSCYDIWYRIQNIDIIKKRTAKYKQKNLETIKEQQKKYREKNKEKIKKFNKEYSKKNKEIIALKNKNRYYKNKEIELNNCTQIIEDKTIKNEVKKIECLINNIPDMKRILVKEFVNGVYSDRKNNTKIKLLIDLNRLLNFLRENCSNKYYGGWNLLELIDIEICQAEIGILKDSIRIFFKWLFTRKKNLVDLSNAIPTSTSKVRINKVSEKTIKNIYEKFNDENSNLELRISGLLIIYYGLTNDELRRLKNDDIFDGKIKLGNDYIDLENNLHILIKNYIKIKNKQLCGVSIGYLFESTYSIKSNSPISLGHFAKLFKKENVGLSPSKLRKAMIYFYKNLEQSDPFFLSGLFRISPRGAARYF